MNICNIIDYLPSVKKDFPRICLQDDAYEIGYIGTTPTVLEKLCIIQIPV